MKATTVSKTFVPLLLVLACGESSDTDPVGVDPGIFSRLGEPRRMASGSEQYLFERGRQVAVRRFTKEDGLGGADFNVTFCASCHEKPVFGGAGARYRNFLLTAEVDERGRYFPLPTNGVQRTFGPGMGENFVLTSTAANHFATRNPIPFFGVGLIDELPRAAIEANADPDDGDADGISGRVNYVDGTVGRFGRKAQTASIEGFIRGPLFNHVGITTNPLTPEERSRLPRITSSEDEFDMGPGIAVTRRNQAVVPDSPVIDNDGVADPELPNEELFEVVSFTLLMGAPEPDALTPQTEAGRELFDAVDCSGCHVAELVGPRGAIPLYSDLLLHDMGDELADGVLMAGASGSEFRTQPLWGIGVVAPYLHDGRADTLDEAIRWHGGEALGSRESYEALSAEEQGLIIAFLESLGGRDQRSAGLLPPDEPVPERGEFGGPWRELSPDEVERFERGRRLFDRDVGTSEGLGPRFNGDSCRACHFEGTVGEREVRGLSGQLDVFFTGGAGPEGLNVVRHGTLLDSGDFIEPEGGTLIHRFLTAPNARNEPDPAANVFELRQAPPIFGMGLIDLIAEQEVVALADPDDANGDGISGRVHRVSGGRLGRMGWKSQVPSVSEFVRDALSVELGLTLPDQPGLTFGVAVDDDDVPDPEASLDEMLDLAFFISMLAPPPPTSTDPALEAEGATLFTDVGCDGCHVPQLSDGAGLTIAAYTDLLLHDVAPDGFRGVADGMAGPREFRTPPLWAVSKTAPYLHNGRASTLDEAIVSHEGEARAVRDAYLGLTSAERSALLAFLRSL